MALQMISMAPSPRQALNSQGVRRIPAMKARNHPKVEDCGTKGPRIGTWNIRSMFMAGKLDNIIKEMARLKLNILGLSEVRWPGGGKQQHNKTTLYYSGSDKVGHPNGVGLLLDGRTSAAVVSFIPHSDRTMYIKLKAYPTNINIIQCYAPTAEKPDQEIEKFYMEVKELLNHAKSNEVTIIMGDMNAKIGDQEVDSVVGKYGLGERNNRGDRLIQFCQDENFVITNTWFKLPKRRLYTWQSPQHNNNNIVRNQIDYILVNSRFRNGLRGIKTYPGADVGSDHNPVVGNLDIRFKSIKKSAPKKIDIRNLKKTDTLINAKRQINKEFEAIKSENVNNTNIEDAWEKIKNKTVKVEQEIIGYGNRIAKKEWMTEEILAMMDHRRLYKNNNIEKYKEIDREIRNKIRAAKEEWMKEKCEEIEILQRKHDSHGVHKKIKEVTHSYKNQHNSGILNENNVLLTEEEEIREEWQTYIRSLFTSNTPRTYDSDKQLEEAPDILKSELQRAIKNSKNGKSAGPDEIHIETLKLLDEENLDPLLKLIQQIYETSNIPKDWLASVFVPLPKKSSAKRCNEFRLISLMSQALKILLKIIQARIHRKCEADLSSTQFGFREGLGTREALAAVSILFQKCRDMRRDIYVCFIDYEKAFDRVDHTLLLSLLQKMGLDRQDIEFIRELYWNQEASIRIGQTTSKLVPIERGVRQGCILSPALFNIYSEHIFDIALEDVRDGIKINGTILNNIRYADDTVIIADSPGGLQRLLNRMVDTGDQFGMKINVAKTKIMAVTRTPQPQPNITIYGSVVECVEKFKYLGCWITNNVDPDVEVRARIEQARAIFRKIQGLVCNSSLDLDIRYRFVQAYVHSTLLYGSETWTLKVVTMNRLEAFEMWTFRRMLKIPWTHHITNEEVLRKMRRDRELLLTTKRRKTAYLGHVYRNPKYDILKLIIEGKIDGKRGPGRRQHSWLKNIRDWTHMSTTTLLRAAQDRHVYANIVTNLH